MQLSKRGKEPVEQPLFRVSETIAPHSQPSTHPRRILPKSPPPHAATATNPRGTRAQPAPYHRPCLPKSRQNLRCALNFRPSRSSRGIRHSAPVQPRHFGCGIRNPLSLRMSAARLHGPNPRRSSGSADNLPKNGYAESSENLPPPATGRALRQRKNTPLPPQPKTATHRASKSPMRKPASTRRLHPILRPTSRPTIRTIRNRPTQPHLRLATTRTRPSLPGSAEPKHALPVPPHPATSAAIAASGRGKEAVTQPRDPNRAL